MKDYKRSSLFVDGRAVVNQRTEGRPAALMAG